MTGNQAMFSKEILSEDIVSLDILQRQQDKCIDLIRQSYLDLLKTDMTAAELDLEKSTISALQDQYDSLNKEIIILKEQMYLNFTNTFKIDPLNNKPHPFRHINSIET